MALSPMGWAQKVSITIPPYVKVAEKKAEFPLKKEKLIFTNEDIRVAKKNIRTFTRAEKLKDSIVNEAKKWTGWNDRDLRGLIPDASVPRAFDLNINGCPVHGDSVFNVGGVYPWILDFKHPLTVTCPVGGETYPSQGYEDRGWGWVAPDQERYWFVAYANEHLQRELSVVLQHLSRAYVLTDNPDFAHKALVILGRLAEVYPSMDHANQSRYGAMLKLQGEDFPGKIFYHIQEARFIRIVAESYDLVWDYIDYDRALQAHYNKDGAEMREFIEANVLEEAIRAYDEMKIQGNYGMHQNALLYTLLARQHPMTGQKIREIVESPGQDQPRMGLKYTLYNQIFRDGMALESPEYNFDWITELSRQMALIKKATKQNLFTNRKSKAFFDSPLKNIVIGSYTPDIGDTGHTLGGSVGRNREVYQSLYQEYQDPAYSYWLVDTNEDNMSFPTFESLFRPPIPDVKPLPDRRVVKKQKSRLFAGYGLGILNNSEDRTALSLSYGRPVYHAHSDFLNFELFANGQKMLPDFGYPDAMNAYIKELYTWSTNTVSHNTIVVDAQRQNQNTPGTLHDFTDRDFARTIDASSGAYKQTSMYRRNLVMVDVDSMQSYVVDFFRVVGGRQHDYLLHGPPGKVTIPDGVILGKAPGAFTNGKEVPWGHIFDDEILGKEGYIGSYSSYSGSGYQYFFNVERLTRENHTIDYQHLSDPDARLKIHRLHQNGHQSFTAEAYDKPRAKKHLIKFLLTRHETAGGESLESSFISVLEPYKATPYITRVRELEVKSTSAKAIEVVRNNEIDIIVSDIRMEEKSLEIYQISTDATTAVVTLDANGQLKRVFFSNGTFLKFRDRIWKNAPIKGIVEQVDYQKGEIQVRLSKEREAEGTPYSPDVVYFSNEMRSTVHPVRELKRIRDRLFISVKDELMIGKISVHSQEGPVITSENSLPLYSHYKGAYVLDPSFLIRGVICEARNKQVTLVQPINTGPAPEVWIANVGVGDRVEIKGSFSKVLTF